MDTSEEKEDDLNSSWIFVGKTESEEIETPTKTHNEFYLDCSQEPVQELSDLESDGISIISESDFSPEKSDIEEDKETETTEITENVTDNDVVQVLETCQLPSRVEKYPTHQVIAKNLLFMNYVVGTAVVILAVLLTPYFSLKLFEENVNLDNCNFYETIRNYERKIVKLEENSLLYCQEIHQMDGLYREHNIGKCLKKMKKLNKNTKKCTKKEFKNDACHKPIITKEGEAKTEKIKVNPETQDAPKKNKEKFQKVPKYESRKCKYKPKPRQDKIVRDRMKNFRDNHYQKPKIKENHRNDENFQRDEVKKRKANKNRAKGETNNFDKIPKDKKKHKKDNMRIPLQKKVNKTSAYKRFQNDDVKSEWFFNLHEFRNKMRHDNDQANAAASWYFRRAEFRRNRRNNAHWYFSYMNNRQNLRY